MFDVSFTLHELLRATEGRLVGDNAPHMVESVFTDTRETAKNALFLAFSGESFDAHDYLAQAAANGASLLCVEESKLGKVPAGVPAIAVPSTVTAFQRIARFHRMRFPNLKVILLSGSCGKTSTKESLRAIFTHALDSISVLATEGNAEHAWTIIDSNWLEEIPQTLEIGGGMFWDSRSHMYGNDRAPRDDEGFFEAADKAGHIKQADTLEELGALIAEEDPNFDVDTFVAEVERYNEMCRNGKDTDFGKHPGLLFELANPPYFVAKSGPSRMVCPGGILINTNGECLDANDQPIPGLYAVGNVSGGLYGVDYPLVILGNSHGRAITFGWLLGRELTGVA